MARFFEDFAVGERWESGAVTLTEAEIIGFARKNDPQPIHTDPVAAVAGRFGGLIASDWQVVAGDCPDLAPLSSTCCERINGMHS